MVKPQEHPIDPVLDDEMVEEWSVSTEFLTGSLPHEHLSAIYGSEAAREDGRPLFVMVHDHDEGRTEFVTNARFDGTQRQALEQVAEKYVGMLGELAVSARVISSRMTVAAIAEALAETQLARHGLDNVGITGVLPEGWQDILDEPSVHTMDVTKQLQTILEKTTR